MWPEGWRTEEEGKEKEKHKEKEGKEREEAKKDEVEESYMKRLVSHGSGPGSVEGERKDPVP